MNFKEKSDCYSPSERRIKSFDDCYRIKLPPGRRTPGHVTETDQPL